MKHFLGRSLDFMSQGVRVPSWMLPGDCTSMQGRASTTPGLSPHWVLGFLSVGPVGSEALSVSLHDAH